MFVGQEVISATGHFDDNDQGSSIQMMDLMDKVDSEGKGGASIR